MPFARRSRAAPDSRYNYRRFRAEHYWPGRHTGPPVGAPLPDLRFETLDGASLGTADLRGRPLVLECGSLTSPRFVARIRAMNRLARRHPDVTFAVVYVREAHPGERIGPHRSMADKRADAHRLVREEREGRRVWLDDIVGTAHRALGGLPDSVCVVDAAGIVRHATPWNDPRVVSRALHQVTATDASWRVTARSGLLSHVVTLRTLKRAGWRALWDRARSAGSVAMATPTPSPVAVDAQA